jgi:NADPH-dependent curcumin reductase CurA
MNATKVKLDHLQPTQQDVEVNRQWTLASRPVGAPTLSDFNFVESKKRSPKSGELL